MIERKSNIAAIRQRLSQRHEAELARFLMAKGIAHSIAEEISKDVAVSSLNESSRFDLLHTALSSRLHTCAGFDLKTPAPHSIALVGPTGIGKTTTVLKLTSLFGVQGNKKVGLISMDAEKGGAFEQLEKYALRWNIPLVAGWEARGDLGHCDLIFIDTTGCNFYEPNHVEYLADRLSSTKNVEIHLTLSAAAKDVDLFGAIHQFSPLPIKSLIFTKLDETLALGVLINICEKVDIPISYVAYGYPLPGEIQAADAKEITRKILVEKNEQEFHFLRQLSIA